MKFFSRKENPISFYTALALVLFMLVSHFLLPKYLVGKYSNELAWDVFTYYIYLPLTFIYHDIGVSDFSIIQGIFDKYNISPTVYQLHKAGTGNWVPIYTLGIAMLYLPFFLIAHVWAHLGGYPPDGFSFPYQFSIATGVLAYVFAGVFVWQKVLLRLFNDKLSALIIFLVVLGTNYFHEAIHDSLMPHAMLFAFYALLLLYTIKWHENPQRKYAIILGLAGGFIVLARGAELFCLLIPVFYGVWNRETLNKKIQLIKKHRSHLGFAVLSAFLVGLPQIIYWIITTKHVVYNCYRQAEGFDLATPHIMEVLFSFKNSWIIYTPLSIFFILSLFYLPWSNKNFAAGIILFIVINFYLMSSWLAWWNGGGFGMRYFVETYPVLSIPFGYLLQRILKSGIFIRTVSFMAIGLFVFLNLFQTWQFTHYIMFHDGRNFEYYKAIFLKTRLTDEARSKLDIQRGYGPTDTFQNPQDYRVRTIGFYNYDEINTTYIDANGTDTSFYLSPPRSFRMSKEYRYSPTLKMRFCDVTSKDHAWVRVSLDYLPVHNMEENPASVIITMDYKGRSFYYRGFDLEKYPYKLNEWNHISFDYLTPYPFSKTKEKLVAYVWHKGDKPFYIDNMHIQAFDRK